MTIPNYYQLPALPDAGLLTRYLDTLGVIVPLARTNLVTNPSVEINTTGYTAVGGAVARSIGAGYYGVAGLVINPTAGTNSDGAYYGTVALVNGTTYAYQCRFKVTTAAAVGKPYTFSIATTGGVVLASVSFIATGQWQWVWGIYTESSTTTRRVYIRKDNHDADVIFAIDGLQVEACSDGVLLPTTYIDGDQRGLVPNQFPAPYGWNGAPHASTSYRSGQTRAGGYIVRFRDLGFLVTAIIGLGLAPPLHEALTFAQLDGGQYQDTIKPPRQFSLAGRWAATTPEELEANIAQLARLLDRDRIAQRQPLVLTTQAYQCGAPLGEMVTIPALYSGGLEGNAQHVPAAPAHITFTQYLPYVRGRDEGTQFQVQVSIANADYLVVRGTNGLWDNIAGLNGTVQAITVGPDGNLYVGGAFTNAGGVAAADGIAMWDGTAWTALGSGVTGGSTVNEIVFDAAGNLYAGGAFTQMGGVANTAALAKWDGATWTALSTGLSGGTFVFALIMDRQNNLYVGGAFTDAGGSGADNLARWNGSAFSVVGSAAAINASVLGLAVDAGNNLYAVGAFTDAGGIIDADRVAKWNGTVWDDLFGGANATVQAVAIGPNGILYAGGTATVFGGVTVGHIAQWNGVSWATMGTAMDSDVLVLYVGPVSGLLYAGGQFTTANGIALPDAAAIWNGYTWLPLDINLPGTAQITAVAERGDGTLYLGYNTSGTAVAAGVNIVTNSSTVGVYPTVIIRGPSSGTSRIYQLINVTTGAAIYFNLIISAGETITLTLDPTNLTLVSNFQGNILNTVLPGSDLTSFVLQPGDNTISFYAASSSVTAYLQSSIGYGSLGDALYRAAP